MNYKISPNDYAELAMYFEGRAEAVKGNLLTVAPWVLAIAAGLISFVVKEGGILSEATMVRLRVAFVSTAGALIICIIASFITYEFGEHAKRNWARAKTAQWLIEQ